MKHYRTHTLIAAQRGISILGLIFWVFLLGTLALVGAKTVPVVTEYMAIKKAVNIAKSAGDAAAIRSSFDQQSRVNYVDNFSGKDLMVENVGGVSTVSFAYQRVIPIAGPMSLLFDFSGKELVR